MCEFGYFFHEKTLFFRRNIHLSQIHPKYDIGCKEIAITRLLLVLTAHYSSLTCPLFKFHYSSGTRCLPECAFQVVVDTVHSNKVTKTYEFKLPAIIDFDFLKY